MPPSDKKLGCAPNKALHQPLLTRNIFLQKVDIYRCGQTKMAHPLDTPFIISVVRLLNLPSLT